MFLNSSCPPSPPFPCCFFLGFSRQVSGFPGHLFLSSPWIDKFLFSPPLNESFFSSFYCRSFSFSSLFFSVRLDHVVISPSAARAHESALQSFFLYLRFLQISPTHSPLSLLRSLPTSPLVENLIPGVSSPLPPDKKPVPSLLVMASSPLKTPLLLPGPFRPVFLPFHSSL